MGLLDILPWRKKNASSSFDSSLSSKQDPFSNSSNAFSSDPFSNQGFSEQNSDDPFTPQGFGSSSYPNSYGNAQGSFNQNSSSQFSNRQQMQQTQQSFSNPMGASFAPDPTHNMHDVNDAHSQDYGRDRDIELILAKLDAIKAELDSVHQRIRKIEQTTEPQQRRNSWN